MVDNTDVEAPTQEEVVPILISSKDPPKKIPLGQLYIQTHPYTQELPPPRSTPPKLTAPPYWPFRTLEDFEQAELFDISEASNETINMQLSLNRKLQKGNSPITLKNARELHETLDRAQVLDIEKVSSFIE